MLARNNSDFVIVLVSAVFSVVSGCSIVEKLHDPISVEGWTDRSLLLEDGRNIYVPGVSHLPKESAPLSEATKRGVEVANDGRIYGLVRINHWCGNDPVRYHLARIDIGHMLSFLGEQQDASNESADVEYGSSFTKWGWNMSEYVKYQQWLESTAPKSREGVDQLGDGS